MASFKVYKVKSLEGAGIVLLARLRDGDGNYVAVADVSTITAVVYNRADGSHVSTLSFVPSDVVYDALQTDARWTEDDDGYNLALPFDGSNFPDGETTYRVEATITPLADAYISTIDFPLVVAWDVQTIESYGS